MLLIPWSFVKLLFDRNWNFPAKKETFMGYFVFIKVWTFRQFYCKWSQSGPLAVVRVNKQCVIFITFLVSVGPHLKHLSHMFVRLKFFMFLNRFWQQISVCWRHLVPFLLCLHLVVSNSTRKDHAFYMPILNWPWVRQRTWLKKFRIHVYLKGVISREMTKYLLFLSCFQIKWMNKMPNSDHWAACVRTMCLEQHNSTCELLFIDFPSRQTSATCNTMALSSWGF